VVLAVFVRMDDVGSSQWTGSTLRRGIAVLVLAFAAIGLNASAGGAAAKSGSLNPGFGNGGKTTSGYPAVPDEGTLQEMVRLPDGSALVLGFSRQDLVLARFGPDGTPDTSFGDRGYATGIRDGLGRQLVGLALAVQSDGRAVVGGSTDPFDAGGLTRYDKSGRPDTSFGTNGLVAIDYSASLIAVDSEDRLIVVGTQGFNTLISRYTSDGRPDRTFGTDGLVTHRFGKASGLYDVSLAAGRITITGPGGTLRLQGDGSLATQFGFNGITGFGGQAMSVQDDGKVVVVDGGTIRRLLTDGTIDPAFGGGGITYGHSANYKDIAIDGVGRIVFAGSSPVPNYTGLQHSEVFRLTPDGQPDAGFGADGVVVTKFAPEGADQFEQVATTPDGRVLAGGTVSPPGFGLSAFGLASYTEAGQADSGFGGGSGQTTTSPLMPSDDRILDSATTAGGYVLTVGKAGFKAGIARYRRNGKLDPTFGEGGTLAERFTDSRYGDSAESVLPVKGGDFYVCVASTEGSTLVRYLSDGSRDQGFGENGMLPLPQLRHCYSLLLDQQGRLLAGGISVNYFPRLIRLDSDGEIDQTYGESGVATGLAFRPSGGGARRLEADLAPNDGAVIAGDRFGGQIQRFTPDGHLRRGFGEFGSLTLRGFGKDNPYFGRIEALDVTVNGQIVIGGTSRGEQAIMKLDPDGIPVRGFGKRGLVTRELLKTGVIEDLEVLKDGRILAAGSARGSCTIFRSSCDTRLTVSRYKSDGVPDGSFGRKGLVMKKFGLGSAGTSLITGREGITVSGYAETPSNRSQFLITRFTG